MVALKKPSYHIVVLTLEKAYSSARLQNCPFKPPAGTGSESLQSRPRVAA